MPKLKNLHLHEVTLVLRLSCIERKGGTRICVGNILEPKEGLLEAKTPRTRHTRSPKQPVILEIQKILVNYKIIEWDYDATSQQSISICIK
jgi:hypothetical protein